MQQMDSTASWRRLCAAIVIGTIGSIGMWSFVVALPAVQADFAVQRNQASLPYTLTMVGFAFGGVFMGRLADRFGVFVPLLIGALALSLGYVASSMMPTLPLYALMHIIVGFGASASFAPLMADISLWFARRRGIAVALASVGNYLAGTLWPPLLQAFIATQGWRAVHFAVGIACLVTLLPLAFLMRQRPSAEARTGTAPASKFGHLELSQNTLLALLIIAGVACCVAMAMPQVHIVAYCADLGYGPARGAEMLSAMLGFGIISRIAAGFIADRIGGLSALIISSTLQGVALFFYLFFDGLASLYIISALFGLFQGGLVPMYAVIVREYFPASKAGATLGLVIMATLFGMAFGGWFSGLIFDWTGSYRLAFLNGLLWNLINVAIVAFLLFKRKFTAQPA
ncbi:MAG TPA: MFS transporter [Beijerinckiaceae bacterium]|jgi:MFS family permease|nr:MFS transporter [Beijerinckiaceae bacterium]